MSTNNDGKVPLTLALDSETTEWLKSEAADNHMTIDEVVESLVHTIRALTEITDETMGAAFSVLHDDSDKELPS